MDRLGHATAQALGNYSHSWHIGVRQQQDELLSTIARSDVGWPHAPGQHLGDPGKNLVPDLVAIGVVHILEKVDVEQNETQGSSIPRCLRHLLCKGMIHAYPVG